MRNAYSEFEIEEFIWNKIGDLDSLRDRGLYLQDALYFRQYPIPGCGIVDIVGFSITDLNFNDGSITRQLNVNIYELKRDAIKCADVGQISRYMDCIRYNSSEILKHFGLDGFEMVVYGGLIGNGIERDAMHAMVLVQNLSDMFCYEFCPEKGISFNPVSAINIHSQKNRHVNICGMPQVSLHALENAKAVDQVYQWWYTGKESAVDFSSN